MPELFIGMMKEEWRIHSTMFGSFSFAMFPVMIFGIAFMGSFLLPLMRTALPAGNLALVIHANFLLLGFMVGAFGLLAGEVMNRRFGQASLLSYSARSLPLPERFIFLNFVIKDTVYYFFLWVFPFGLGYIAASPFTGVTLVQALLLLLTLTLSFLFGLCVIFFLSAVYAYSKRALWLLVLVLGAGWGALVAVTGINPALFSPRSCSIRRLRWSISSFHARSLSSFSVRQSCFSALNIRGPQKNSPTHLHLLYETCHSSPTRPLPQRT